MTRLWGVFSEGGANSFADGLDVMRHDITPRDLARSKGRAELTFSERGKTAGRMGLQDRNRELSPDHVRFEVPVGHPGSDTE